MRHSARLRILVFCGACILAARGAAGQQQPAITPSSPAVVAAPAWSRTLEMPDGRTFVTDGGLMLDVRLARPAILPSVVLPPETAKRMLGYLTGPYDAEFAFADLKTGPYKNTFVAPNGIPVNGNYINLLRQVVTPAVTRLRTRGKTDPVVVVTGGQAVAIMMPIATP